MGCKGNRKSEFMAKTQYLYQKCSAIFVVFRIKKRRTDERVYILYISGTREWIPLSKFYHFPKVR